MRDTSTPSYREFINHPGAWTSKSIGGKHGITYRLAEQHRRTSLGVFFINYFFLPGPLRLQRLGSEILRQGEAEAYRRGVP